MERPYIRKYIDFPDNVRLKMQNDTWCFTCQANLEMIEPKAYEEARKLYVEGRSTKCGNKDEALIIFAEYREPDNKQCPI